MKRCDEVLELEAEIALGIADGEERAGTGHAPPVLAVAAGWLGSPSWPTSCCSWRPWSSRPPDSSPTSSSGCAEWSQAGAGRCRARHERSPRSPRCWSPPRPRWPGCTSQARTFATTPRSTGTSCRRRTAATSGRCRCATGRPAPRPPVRLRRLALLDVRARAGRRGLRALAGRAAHRPRRVARARLLRGRWRPGSFGRALPVPLREVERVELLQASGPGRLTAVSRRR